MPVRVHEGQDPTGAGIWGWGHREGRLGGLERVTSQTPRRTHHPQPRLALGPSLGAGKHKLGTPQVTAPVSPNTCSSLCKVWDFA